MRKTKIASCGCIIKSGVIIRTCAKEELLKISCQKAEKSRIPFWHGYQISRLIKHHKAAFESVQYESRRSFLEGPFIDIRFGKTINARR